MKARKDPVAAVRGGEDAVHPIPAGEMEGILGDALALIGEKVLGVLAQVFFDFREIHGPILHFGLPPGEGADKALSNTKSGGIKQAKTRGNFEFRFSHS